MTSPTKEIQVKTAGLFKSLAIVVGGHLLVLAAQKPVVLEWAGVILILFGTLGVVRALWIFGVRIRS